MASFEFSLNNGLALIMPAGGGTACGQNFTAGVNDAVFKVTGNIDMQITDGGEVIIYLNNIHGLIFANKANYSSWLYYDTLWARAHGNCMHIWMDAALSRQGHGGWYDGNAAWQYGAGWKGGTGIRGYDQWIKYRYDIVEGDCAGEYVGTNCCASGAYIGSAKNLNSMTFNLGRVDFATTKGFWLGANLDCYEGGWEQWQYIEFPVIVFAAPTISAEVTDVDICEETAGIAIDLESNNSLAASGGTWEIQYSTDPSFANAVTSSKVVNTPYVSFEDITITPNVRYYIRGRLKVSSIRYSNWASTSIIANGVIPRADAMASDIVEGECHNLKHGYLVEGGII